MSSENEIILRVKDTEMFGEFDKTMQALSSEGYFKALAREGKLTIEMVNEIPVTKLCEVFVREDQKLEAGDYIVFSDGSVTRFEN